jgi:hypothetical protein
LAMARSEQKKQKARISGATDLTVTVKVWVTIYKRSRRCLFLIILPRLSDAIRAFAIRTRAWRRQRWASSRANLAIETSDFAVVQANLLLVWLP